MNSLDPFLRHHVHVYNGHLPLEHLNHYCKLDTELLSREQCQGGLSGNDALNWDSLALYFHKDNIQNSFL